MWSRSRCCRRIGPRTDAPAERTIPKQDLIADNLRPGAAFEAAEQRVLFSTRLFQSNNLSRRTYEITPNDRRFLFARIVGLSGTTPAGPLNLVRVDNWFTELGASRRSPEVLRPVPTGPRTRRRQGDVLRNDGGDPALARVLVHIPDDGPATTRYCSCGEGIEQLLQRRYRSSPTCRRPTPGTIRGETRPR